MSFTVDLDSMWKEWGYSEKSKAVNFLKRNYTQDTDYIVRLPNGQTNRGGNNRKIYILTVSCAFKMAENIKTQKATDFKNDKLKELSNPVKIIESMPTELLAQVLLERADKTRKRLEAKIALDAPKIEAYEQFIESTNTQTVNEVAKTLGYGRNRFFEKLRKAGIFVGTLPRQKYLDSEHFVVKQSVKNGMNFSYTRVTPKGIEFLFKKITKQGEKNGRIKTQV